MENLNRIAVSVIERSNQVLLVQRSSREGNLNWQFPAGKLEFGEDPFNAAEREVYEETGVRCKSIKTLGSRKVLEHKVFIYYVLCVYTSGKEFLKDRRENKDIRWVNVNDIRSYIPVNLFEGIAEYFEI